MGIFSIKACKLKEMMDKKEYDLIIDLRNSEYYELGHLPGSINIPLNQITDKMDFLEKYKTKKVILYCSVGCQSINVAKFLVLNGFKKVYTLDNGLKEYKYELIIE